MADNPLSSEEGQVNPRPSRLKALAKRVGPSARAVERHYTFRWLVAALVLLAVPWVAYTWLMESLVHSRKEIMVPDLVGQTPQRALDVLSDFDLSLAKDAVEFDESYPPGTIIKQDPVASVRVREGKVIRVTLSSGGQAVFMPDLTNKPLAEAQNLLRQEGLLAGAVTEAHSERYEAGWIMGQTPSSGTIIQRGEMADLLISKGPPPKGTVLMPDFVSKTYTRAREWAEEKGYRAKRTWEVRSDLLPGLVLAQSPPPDTLLTESAAVEFTVSKSTLTAANASVFRYEVPPGSGRVKVKVVARDDNGERVIFDDYQNAGALVEAPIVKRGPARARIFVNGVLVEERVLN